MAVKRLMYAGLVIVLGVLGAFVYSSAQAQPLPIAVEVLSPRAVFTDDVAMQIRNKLDGQSTDVINVSDPSRIVTAKITVQPGAQFPWHTHPGPVFVTVAEGELTYVAARRLRRAALPGRDGVRRPGPRPRAHRVQLRQRRHGDRDLRDVLRGASLRAAHDPGRRTRGLRRRCQRARTLIRGRLPRSLAWRWGCRYSPGSGISAVVPGELVSDPAQRLDRRHGRIECDHAHSTKQSE